MSPSIKLSMHSPGMDNPCKDYDGKPITVNLMERAISYAENGLNEPELEALKDLAKLDGVVTDNEKLLLDSLSEDRQSFSDTVSRESRRRGYEPENFVWEVKLADV